MPSVTSSASSTSVELHYEDTGGPGRPVVLIHGWPLSGASWSGQVPALQAAGYRVVTYDRRGFGESGKPGTGNDYDTMAADLDAVLTTLDLADVTLVGFSMGGGEVARYVGNHGQGRLHSIVFAAAVPPYLLKGDDNPDGALGDADVEGMQQGVQADREGFLDGFTTTFFSAGGELKVTEDERADALALAAMAEEHALVDCIDAFSRTDFRDDLAKVTVPALIIHGDADAIVPIEAAGQRTHDSIDGSRLVVLAGGPHGCNVSHRDEFNAALLDFLSV
ncbi:MAG: alpha/beta hydrolase [Lapillicoccus sp.]